MDKSKYTFLLPAYKAQFFEEALLSIKNQTYTDFVCIVSDDCSPEDLRSVFDKVCSDDSRFSYRRNEHNIGGKNLVQHWNMLVDMCETEYLIMASDDDVYSPNFLKEMDDLCIRFPDVCELRARVQDIDASGEVLSEDPAFLERMTQLQYIESYMNPLFHLCLANTIYKRDELLSVGKWKEFPLAWKTDSALNIEMSKNGVCSSKNILFSFRRSSINISMQNNSATIGRQKLESTVLFYKWFIPFLNTIIPTDKKEERSLGRVRSYSKAYLCHSMFDFVNCLNLPGYIRLLNFMYNERLLHSRFAWLRSFIGHILKVRFL